MNDKNKELFQTVKEYYSQILGELDGILDVEDIELKIIIRGKDFEFSMG